MEQQENMENISKSDPNKSKRMFIFFRFGL